MNPHSAVLILGDKEKKRLMDLAVKMGVTPVFHTHTHFEPHVFRELGEGCHTTMTMDVWFVELLENLVTRLEEVEGYLMKRGKGEFVVNSNR